jgi:putative phosphoribosyl transferase
MSLRFRSRETAGELLAQRLRGHRWPAPPVVLALPRGGVPVAVPVARALGAPLDLVLVRKIGLPWQPELAVAAVVDGAEPRVVVDEDVRAATGIGHDEIETAARRELAEIERRRRVYLGGRPPVPVEGRTAIVVDDGIATGTSVRAALKALRARRPAALVLAVPVAPPEAVAALEAEVDELVCLSQPVPFHAIGLHYDDFHQLADAEVLALLGSALPGAGARGVGPGGAGE